MSTDLSSYILKEIPLKSGQQLIIRKPIVDDAEKMIKYLNIIGEESDNLLFGKGEFHLTVEQEIEYIKSISNTPNIFMILGIIDNNIISMGQISTLIGKESLIIVKLLFRSKNLIGEMALEVL